MNLRRDMTLGRSAFLLASVLFFGAFLVYPVFYLLKGAVWHDGQWNTTFVRTTLTDSSYWGLVANSVNLAIIVTFFTVLLSIPIAWLMVRRRFPAQGLVAGLLLVPLILPPFVGAVGMRQMFARFGSVNLVLLKLGVVSEPVDWFGGSGLAGVVVMQILHLYPIMYLNLAAAMSNIDPTMEEAAQNVGASGFRLFRRITLPLMMPGFFAGASIVFVWAFTDLGTPLMFECRDLLPVRIYSSLNEIHDNPTGYVMVVFMMLTTALFFITSKLLAKGKRYDQLARGHVQSSAKRISAVSAVPAYLFLLGVVGVALLPHLGVFMSSIAERWSMSIVPEAMTAEHYANLTTHPLTAVSIRNSLVLSLSSTVVDVVLGVAIAYLLVRTTIPGRAVLETLAMLPLAIPGVIMAFGYVGAYSGTILDARNNPTILLVAGYAIRRLPYMVRSAYAGFQQLNPVLEEAAMNVGATPFATLRRISLPLVAANLGAGAILCFSFAMLEVSDSLILAAEEKYFPITKAIYVLTSRPDGLYVASALGVLAMILLGGALIISGKILGKRMGELFRV